MPRTVLAAAATALAAGVGAVLSGLLPMPPGMAHGLTVAGDPAGAATLITSTTHHSPAPSPAGATTSPPGGAPGTTGATTEATAAPPATGASPSAASGSASPSPTATTTPSAVPSTSPSQRQGEGQTPGQVAAAQAAILSLVNAARAQQGCGALTASPALTTLAQSFSTEMAQRGFFSHTDPDGRTPWDRAKALGITNLGGENIARGQPTAQAVMTAWLDSPGHRANILDCDYHSLGVGAYFGPGGPWWTEDFGF